MSRQILIHALYLLGLVCMNYGVWMVYRPAGWMIGGAMLFVFSLLIDRLSNKDNREPR